MGMSRLDAKLDQIEALVDFLESLPDLIARQMQLSRKLYMRAHSICSECGDTRTLNSTGLCSGCELAALNKQAPVSEEAKKRDERLADSLEFRSEP